MIHSWQCLALASCAKPDFGTHSADQGNLDRQSNGYLRRNTRLISSSAVPSRSTSAVVL